MVLFRSEQHSCKVIQATSWTSYTLIWSLITCLLLATTGHCNNRNQQFNNHCCFICLLRLPWYHLVAKTKTNLILESSCFKFMPNCGHLFNASSVICPVCCISHGCKVVAYSLVVLDTIHEMQSQIHYAVIYTLHVHVPLICMAMFSCHGYVLSIWPHVVQNNAVVQG